MTEKQEKSGALPPTEDRATHEQSPQAVSAVPVGIPSAVRRTLKQFDSHPRDGTPFHILNLYRFNPVMGRHEALAWSEDGKNREWVAVRFLDGRPPTYWLRLAPLPYEVPDTGWFPVDFCLTYLVKRKSRWSRIWERLFGKAKGSIHAWQWIANAQVDTHPKGGDSSEAPAPLSSAVGEADAPKGPTP